MAGLVGGWVDGAFDRAVELVLRHEGGYVNDPDDRGGQTKYGISARAYPKLDIKALTRDQAVEIYRADYWERHGFHRLEHPVLAAKVFDVAVTVGPGRAVRWLQKAAGAPQDGLIGPVTASAVNLAEPVAIMGRFLGQAAKHYLALAQPKFQPGWIRRLFDF